MSRPGPGTDPVNEESYVFADAVVDVQAPALFVGGQRVRIEPLPFQVLLTLLRAAPDSVPVDALGQAAWGEPTLPNTVAKAISRVRQALGQPRLVCAVSGRGPAAPGFRMAVAVERISRADDRHPLGELAPSITPTRTIRDFLRDVIAAAKAQPAELVSGASTVTLLAGTSSRWMEAFQRDPRAEAQIRLELAKAFHHLADLPDGTRELRLAVQRLSPVVAPQDPLLLLARFNLAALLSLTSHLDEAQRELETAERCAAAALAVDDAPLQLAAEHARFAYHHMRGNLPAATPPGQRMLSLVDRVAPDDLSLRFSVRLRMAAQLQRTMQLDEALHLMRITMAAPFSAATVGDWPYARGSIQLARIQVSLGRTQGAEQALLDARTVLFRRFGTQDMYVGVADAELANLFAQRGQFQRAAEALTSAVECCTRSSHNPDHQSVHILNVNLGIVSLNAGQAQAGLALLEQERPLFVRDWGGEAGFLAQIIDFHRARALSDLGRAPEALPLLARLDPRKLEQAEQCQYMDAWLQAEQGRARVLAHPGTEGRPQMADGLSALRQRQAPAWIVQAYATLLDGEDAPPPAPVPANEGD